MNRFPLPLKACDLACVDLASGWLSFSLWSTIVHTFALLFLKWIFRHKDYLFLSHFRSPSDFTAASDLILQQFHLDNIFLVLYTNFALELYPKP